MKLSGLNFGSRPIFNRATTNWQEVKAKIAKDTCEKVDDTPKCVDPLTGKLITADEFNSKYDNGKALLYVYVPQENGMIRRETMTADMYCRRYGTLDNPPKADLA